jgi:heme exporter protein D
MMDLGPHAEFIWLSYAAAVVVVAALMVWAFGGEARNRAKLTELERRGITRRSRGQQQDGASSGDAR